MHEEKKAWAGFPADLRELLIAVYLGEGEGVVEKAATRLLDEINQADADDEDESLERVVWLDRLMRDSLMDFSVHCGDWDENKDQIAAMLEAGDNLLARLSDSGDVARRAHKTEASDFDATALSQRLNVYLGVSAALAEDEAEFHARLSRSLEDAKANVGYLLSHPDAEDLIGMEDVTDYGHYLPGQKYFTEPLAMMRDCSVYLRKARMVRRAYEEYVAFLEHAGADPRAIRGKLLLDAEQALGALLDWSIDEIHPDYPIDFGSSEALRALLAENPDRPIVVFAGPEGTPEVHADIKSVELIDVLNAESPSFDGSATLITNREDLESLIGSRMKRCLRGLGHDGPATDEQLKEAVRMEMARYEPAWVKAIAVRAQWREL